ncbi:MAG: hypothetical protein F6K30_27020, partial [Cyanothece sp. SIO2G6]|nr:hypothetical protein [Cyanothece sp. SIO2G6]
MTYRSVPTVMGVCLITTLLASMSNIASVLAQTDTIRSNDGIQRDLERQPVPLEPLPLPEAPPDPNLQAPSPDTILPDLTAPIPGESSIIVERFEMTGNTVFSNATLLSVPLNPSNPAVGEDESQSCLPNTDIATATIGATVNQPFAISQLVQVATRISQFYACEGYIAVTKIVVIPDSSQQPGRGIVQIQVIEGTLEDVQVISNTRRSIFTLNND